jgi:hypothetical protein
MKAIIGATTKLLFFRSSYCSSLRTPGYSLLLCQSISRIQYGKFFSTEKVTNEMSVNDEKTTSDSSFTDLINRSYDSNDNVESPIRRKRLTAYPRFSSKQELFLFQNYKALHGHLDIKQNYFIPAVAEWPVWSHYFPLGALVARMRHFHKHQQIRPNTITLYTELGFIWDYRLYKQENMVQALQTFHTLHGHHQVPSHFVVPSDPYWPRNTWGVKLGVKVADLRSKENRYFYLRERLDEVGLGKCSKKVKKDFVMVYNGLLAYKAKHGDLLVPRSYTIARNDESFPEECRGLYLGEIVNNIRNHNSYLEFKAKLLAIGFHYGHMKYFVFQKIFRAIQRYNQLHGNVEVPDKYVISSDTKDFDEEFWGMKLGRIVKQIKSKGTYYEYRKYFAELGLKAVRSIVYPSLLHILFILYNFDWVFAGKITFTTTKYCFSYSSSNYCFYN